MAGSQGENGGTSNNRSTTPPNPPTPRTTERRRQWYCGPRKLPLDYIPLDPEEIENMRDALINPEEPYDPNYNYDTMTDKNGTVYNRGENEIDIDDDDNTTGEEDGETSRRNKKSRKRKEPPRETLPRKKDNILPYRITSEAASKCQTYIKTRTVFKIDQLHDPVFFACAIKDVIGIDQQHPDWMRVHKKMGKFRNNRENKILAAAKDQAFMWFQTPAVKDWCLTMEGKSLSFTDKNGHTTIHVPPAKLFDSYYQSLSLAKEIFHPYKDAIDWKQLVKDGQLTQRGKQLVGKAFALVREKCNHGLNWLEGGKINHNKKYTCIRHSNNMNYIKSIDKSYIPKVADTRLGIEGKKLGMFFPLNYQPRYGRRARTGEVGEVNGEEDWSEQFGFFETDVGDESLAPIGEPLY